MTSRFQNPFSGRDMVNNPEDGLGRPCIDILCKTMGIALPCAKDSLQEKIIKCFYHNESVLPTVEGSTWDNH